MKLFGLPPLVVSKFKKLCVPAAQPDSNAQVCWLIHRCFLGLMTLKSRWICYRLSGLIGVTTFLETAQMALGLFASLSVKIAGSQM